VSDPQAHQSPGQAFFPFVPIFLSKMAGKDDRAMYLLVANELNHIADSIPNDQDLKKDLKKDMKKLSERTKKLAEGGAPNLTNIFDIEDRLEALEKRVSELSEENRILRDRLEGHGEPVPVAFDMELYEANKKRYQSMRDLGKFQDRKGYYGLFLTDGRNLVFNLQSSALQFQKKLQDESAYTCMLHGENAECIGPI
jgi:hypothetical protein